MAAEKKLTAALLCTFLGIFGAHRFYVGKIGTGFLQLIRVCVHDFT
jgi:TM2 domain-containing membrane protein YozV